MNWLLNGFRQAWCRPEQAGVRTEWCSEATLPLIKRSPVLRKYHRNLEHLCINSFRPDMLSIKEVMGITNLCQKRDLSNRSAVSKMNASTESSNVVRIQVLMATRTTADRDNCRTCEIWFRHPKKWNYLRTNLKAVLKNLTSWKKIGATLKLKITSTPFKRAKSK